jgi:RelA/SpoT family (p)ppGpp synthetase
VPTIDALTSRLDSYLNKEQVQQVRRAYYYAEQAHDGQRRRSGEPYIIHPLAVANILSEMHMDHQSLMAAMLHDVIEDTAVPKEALQAQFGDTVSQLVDGVSKLTNIKFESKAEQQAENFQKMALAMAQDIRVILVKLADRLHNMRTLDALRPEKKRRIAKETMDIYAPIANRLGINNIRLELEDLCFAAQYPMRSSMIKKAVLHARGHRKEIVEKISNSISNRLEEHGLVGRVNGREKHLFSIYQKMKTQHKPFSEIMDVYAFRIITDSVDTCYRTLGAIHSLYTPVPDKFKDYVAVPKANGYQSLHTVLFTNLGVPIEVQIRTEEMEAMANHGIAAHWLYKTDKQIDGDHRTKRWIQGLLELQQRAGNSQEFIENVKIDLFPDEIYVFTPKGNIMDLPKGATAVDFAYAVHTDVGNACVACRINRHLAPLSQPLESGQTIEIIRAPSAKPNPAWLNFVITGKARTNIRHFLKNQHRSESVSLGKRLVDKALAGFDLCLEDFDQAYIEKALVACNFETMDDWLEDVGQGNQMAYMVARHLLSATPEHDVESTDQGSAPLVIQGTEGVMVSYAKCCSPLPGDPIIGHISSGRGLVIHTDNCKNIADIKNNPEKCTYLSWGKDIDTEFTCELKIILDNRRGVIALVASAAAEADANIEKITIEDRDARLSVISLQVTVQGRKHIARVIRRIRTIKSVEKITRVKS